MDLGQIRNLTKRLIHDCDKCGKIPVNFFSGDESQTGYVKIDWATNAGCQPSENCIDPKDLVDDDNLKNNGTSNGTTGGTANGATDKKNNGAAGAAIMGRGYLGGLIFLGAFFIGILS